MEKGRYEGKDQQSQAIGTYQGTLLSLSPQLKWGLTVKPVVLSPSQESKLLSVARRTEAGREGLVLSLESRGTAGYWDRASEQHHAGPYSSPPFPTTLPSSLSSLNFHSTSAMPKEQNLSPMTPFTFDMQKEFPEHSQSDLFHIHPGEHHQATRLWKNVIWFCVDHSVIISVKCLDYCWHPFSYATKSFDTWDINSTIFEGDGRNGETMKCKTPTSEWNYIHKKIFTR